MLAEDPLEEQNHREAANGVDLVREALLGRDILAIGRVLALMATAEECVKVPSHPPDALKACLR